MISLISSGIIGVGEISAKDVAIDNHTITEIFTELKRNPTLTDSKLEAEIKSAEESIEKGKNACRKAGILPYTG